MRRHRPRFSLFCCLSLLLATGNAWALVIDQLFVAGASQGERLGEARSRFAPDELQLYVRFSYREARPGQNLIAHWQLLRDVQGRSGEFATSELALEKTADLGQFSFRMDESWPIGSYRVTLTDAGHQIIGEVDFEVAAPTVPLASDPIPPAAPQFEEIEPLPFTARYAPPAGLLKIGRVFTAGRQEAQRFDTGEPVIYVRFEYEGAAPGQIVDAVWEHRGEQGKGGIGVFARSRLALAKAADQGQFSFRPQAPVGWLAGDYRVRLVSGPDALAQAQFSIAAAPPPAKAAASQPAPKAAKKPAAAKPSPKPAEAARTIAPSVLEATLAKGIEDARPKDATSEFTNVWRRLLLWARIDGGNQGGEITARWYSGDTLQAEHAEAVGPGENWVVFWLHVGDNEVNLPIGPARIELRHGKTLLRTIDYQVRQAGFLDGLSDSLHQMGNEMQWLIDQQIKD